MEVSPGKVSTCQESKDKTKRWQKCSLGIRLLMCSFHLFECTFKSIMMFSCCHSNDRSAASELRIFSDLKELSWNIPACVCAVQGEGMQEDLCLENHSERPSTIFKPTSKLKQLKKKKVTGDCTTVLPQDCVWDRLGLRKTSSVWKNWLKYELR